MIRTKKMLHILLFSSLLGATACMQARDINVEGLGLKRAFTMAHDKMVEAGVEPTEAFKEVYAGLEAGQLVFDHALVMSALLELNIVKPKF